jgi:hypothetical protein
MSGDFDARIWVHERTLPTTPAQWLDPDIPLPDDVELLPTRVEGMDPRLLFFFAAIFGGFALLLLPDLPATWASDRADERYGNTGFFVVLLGIAAAGIRSGLGNLSRQRDARTGRRRFGLFLGPEGLLFRRISPDGCVVLPRPRVTGARVVQENPTPDGYRVVVIDSVTEGGPPRAAPAILGLFPGHTLEEVAQRVAQWAEAAGT